jgi:hypothetical protein
MALTTGRNIRLRETGKKRYAVIATNAVIYKHALVALNAAGRLAACANSTTQKGAGLACDTYATGDGSTVFGEYYEDCLALLPIAATVTAALALNTKLYAADDETVTTATTLGPEIGTLAQIPATGDAGETVTGHAWIHIRGLQTGVAS